MSKGLRNRKIAEIALIAAIAVLTFIIVAAACYTYLCTDDFSFICGARDRQEEMGNSFLASVRAAYGYYNSAQGTYLFNFLVYFINPYARWGLPGLHAVMVINVLLYVYAVWYLCSSLCNEKIHKLFFMLMVLAGTFCASWAGGNKELFLWYTGALNYTLELALSMITFGIMVRYFKGRMGAKSLIAASVLGFLASGGSLEITAVHCAWLLILLITGYKKLLKDKKIIIPFVVSVAGALINTVAPGNYAKADKLLVDGHSTVFDAIRDSFVCIGRENKTFFTSVLTVFILLAVMAASYYFPKCICGEKVALLYVIGAAAAAFVVQLLAVFPIMLGYHQDYLGSMRTEQSFYLVLLFMYMYLAYTVGAFLAGLELKKKYIPVLVMALVFVAAFTFSGHKTADVHDGFASCIMRDMKSGNLRNNYNVRSYILDTLEMAEEDSDVILFLPYYECYSTYSMGVDEDPHSFTNTSVENWKRIKSLTVYYLGLTYPAE